MSESLFEYVRRVKLRGWLIPWRKQWGSPGDSSRGIPRSRYIAWHWRGKIVTPARRVAAKPSRLNVDPPEWGVDFDARYEERAARGA